jgi:hypothetical protein
MLAFADRGFASGMRKNAQGNSQDTEEASGAPAPSSVTQQVFATQTLRGGSRAESAAVSEKEPGCVDTIMHPLSETFGKHPRLSVLAAQPPVAFSAKAAAFAMENRRCETNIRF